MVLLVTLVNAIGGVRGFTVEMLFVSAVLAGVLQLRAQLLKKEVLKAGLRLVAQWPLLF